MRTITQIIQEASINAKRRNFDIAKKMFINGRSYNNIMNFAIISAENPDIEAIKALRKDNSNGFFGPNVIKICQMADIVFLGLHGENGENGKVQAAFDLLNIKCYNE